MTFLEMYRKYQTEPLAMGQNNILFPKSGEIAPGEWYGILLSDDKIDIEMLEGQFLSEYGDLDERITDTFPINPNSVTKTGIEYTPFRNYYKNFNNWILSIDNVMNHALGLAKMNYTPYENYDKHSTITTTNSGSDTITNVIGETNTESTFDDDTNTSTIGAHTDKETYSPTITTYDQDIEYNQGSDETRREFAQQLHQTHRDGRTDSVITYEHTDTNTTAHGHKIVVEDVTHGNIGVMDGATMGMKDYEYMLVNDLIEFFFKLYVRDFGGNSWG